MIIPKDKYPAQTDDTDATGYPHGAARNANSPNDGNGFPLEKEWVNDVLGFFQALAEAAGITPSGDPEKVGESDLLDALDALYYRRSLIDSALDTKITAASARYSVPNGASSPVGLTQQLTDPGFSLVGGTAIEVPQPGRYLVAWRASLATTDSGSVVTLSMPIRVGGSEVTRAVGSRFSATTTHHAHVSASAIVQITDPESERIDFTLVGVGTVSAVGEPGMVSVVSVGP